MILQNLQPVDDRPIVSNDRITVYHEWRRMWNEAVMAYFRHYFSSCLGGERGTEVYCDRHLRAEIRTGNKYAVTPLYVPNEAEMMLVFTTTSVHSNGGFIRSYGQTF
jgi:hypothetical protein